ncbi:MAG: hypothetical protein KatS3mg084_0600 [Candidatus Dojkabacteria bacterium]|nr:MAG: hypothetical protein KatS3mg084_0600 [Candidatus Dojkabacteria bacterium]
MILFDMRYFVKMASNKDKNILNKLKRIFCAALPSRGDLVLFGKSLVFLFAILLGLSLFSHLASPVKAFNWPWVEEKEVDSAPDAFFQYMNFQVAGCFGLSQARDIKYSAFTENLGVGRKVAEYCRQLSGPNAASSDQKSGMYDTGLGWIQIDYGATGRLINATASVYGTQAVQPGMTVEYYAKRIRGEVLAADNPMSGRSVLAPILVLNQNLVNLAYGLVVVVLLVSSLNILLSSLTGQEEKVTIVQLVMNAGVTLLIITFYYEIAAIIYDLTVNYGNALVASMMAPFINSKVILERLSPGGDLAVINLLNVYQFVGVSDALLVVLQSIMSGLYPAIAQSTSAIGASLGGRGTIDSPFNIFAGIFQFAGGLGATGASIFISSFLGNAEIFQAIISWTIFGINIKIFINLLTSFVTFTIYVGFGPLIALGGIDGGFARISESFKKLFALGLVFPMTFLFILLGATALNLSIREKPYDASQDSVKAIPLCKYSPSDPANTENSIIDNAGLTQWLQDSIGGNPDVEDPARFRNKNFVNQNIFDVVPKGYIDGLRDCRPSLFPVPWTFIPAPFGTVGQRQLQIQTIDSLVRTFLALVFIILAARVPSIVNEALGVREMNSLSNITSAFGAGAKGAFGAGGTIFATGLGMLSAATSAATRVPIPLAGHLNSARGLGQNSYLQAVGGVLGRVVQRLNPSSVQDIIANYSKRQSTPAEMVNQFNSVRNSFLGATPGAAPAGVPTPGTPAAAAAGAMDPAYASLIAAVQLGTAFKDLSQQTTALGTVFSTFGGSIVALTTQIQAFAKELRGFIATISIDDV